MNGPDRLAWDCEREVATDAELAASIARVVRPGATVAVWCGRDRYTALLDAMDALPSTHLRPSLTPEERDAAERERARLEDAIEALPLGPGGAP